MGMRFPSAEFFTTLQVGLKESGASEGVTPSEAYCGLMVDRDLFVLEFDGHQCAAVVSGGNSLDQELVLAGSRDAWYRALDASTRKPSTLGELLDLGDLRIEADLDDGEDLARAALPMLQVFADQAAGLDDIDF
jgi:hypothetical protein